MPDRSDLHEFIQSQPLVDTHEHLLPEEECLRLNPDILSVLLSHYLQHDLICSGASFEPDTAGFLASAPAPTPHGAASATSPDEAAAAAAADATLATRFRTVEEAWKSSAHTGFGEAARLTAERVYGIADISTASLRAAEPLHAALLEPSKHFELLRDVANLDSVQIDGFAEVSAAAGDPAADERDTDRTRFYRHDINLRSYCAGESADELSFERYEQELEGAFARSPGAVAVKTQHAYDRPLQWERRDRDEARRAYEAAGARGQDGDGGAAAGPRAQAGPRVQPEPNPVVGDWALAEVARLCAEYRLPLKIHTGYMAGTGFMDTRGMGPGGLSPLFKAYPRTTFVLMHISYPYWCEAIALSKHYPNVYLDMCWAWSIDPHSSREFVRTFIHTVPSHKLFAFGGDTFLPVAVVGFAEQARSHLARALTAEIDEDLLSEREAIELARRFMHENQYEVFHLAC